MIIEEQHINYWRKFANMRVVKQNGNVQKTNKFCFGSEKDNECGYPPVLYLHNYLSCHWSYQKVKKKLKNIVNVKRNSTYCLEELTGMIFVIC